MYPQPLLLADRLRNAAFVKPLRIKAATFQRQPQAPFCHRDLLAFEPADRFSISSITLKSGDRNIDGKDHLARAMTLREFRVRLEMCLAATQPRWGAWDHAIWSNGLKHARHAKPAVLAHGASGLYPVVVHPCVTRWTWVHDQPLPVGDSTRIP